MAHANPAEVVREKHIIALDGVRGLAILMVLIFHYGGGAKSGHPLVHMTGLLIRFGWSGVSLFFVLSGFLITGILWDARKKPHWWKNFYARRALRIFPLYYFALLLTICFAQWHGEVWPNIKGFITYALYLQNYPTAFPHIPFTTLDLSHFWSLAVEEQFYLVWPFIIYFSSSRQSAKRICVAVVAGSFAFRLLGLHYQFVDLGSLTLARAGELASGAWLSLSIRGTQSEWKNIVRVAPACMIFAALGLAGIALYDHGFNEVTPWMLSVGFCLLALISSSLIVLAISGSWVRHAMQMRWLRWLGKVSYGLYVYQILFIGLYRSLARFLVGNRNQTMTAIMIAVIGLPCTFFIVILSFKFIESPLLQLKSRFGHGKELKITEPLQHIPK